MASDLQDDPLSRERSAGSQTVSLVRVYQFLKELNRT